MILALFLALVILLAALVVLRLTGPRRPRRVAPLFYETPLHLYGRSLVADEGGGEADEFVLPEDLTTLTAEFDDDGVLVGGTLHDLETQAVEAFDAIRAGDMTADDVANLAQLADAVDAIRADATRRTEESAATQTAAEELANRVHPVAPAAAEGAEGEGAGAGEGAEGEGGEGAEGEGEGEGGEGAGAEGAGAQEPESVTAGAQRRAPIRVPLGRVRANAPAPAQGPDAGGLPEGMTITAAADVPGMPNGGAVTSTAQIAQMAHARARGLSNGSQALVATIHQEYPETISEEDTRDTMRDAMEAVRDVNVLTAAGGWCAPSDRIWDYFSVESTGGLVDIPTLGITRGGLEYPVSPSIGDVFDTPWLWTEDDDIAALGNPHEDPEDDVTKPCFRVPCGTWAEVRLRAHGVCVTAGNLTDAAWPEQTRKYIDLVMAAHAHVMNARNLARMVALSTAVTIGTTSNAAASILNAIELQVLDYRDKFRMGDSVLLEGVFDVWVLGLIRADIARRGGVAIEEVPNSRIIGWFQERGVRPQFVHDFHPLQLGASGSPDGFRETWPTSVTFLLYAAGTFVRGTGTTIDLGVTRDSRLNEVNDHTAAWTEEADLVARLGHESRVITIAIVPNGVTSAPATAPTGPLA